ncbi:MAG: hypothetical protein KGI41_00710 [Patescibacteria group bacterium]|nr:hypothetical protein [Patescibacteria group bacterium]
MNSILARIPYLKFFGERRRMTLAVLAALILALVALGVYVRYSGTAARYATPQEADPYVRFDMEAFDSILANYWMPHDKYDLSRIFDLSAEKVTGGTFPLATSTRAATAAMLAKAFSAATSTAAKRDFAEKTVAVVLYNLIPNGRDQLLSAREETALRQDVSNINPASNLYDSLGLAKGASLAEVDAAYAKKEAALAASSSPDAAAKRQELAYAHEVLGSGYTKSLYDTAQIEPSVFKHILGHTLYLDFDKVSPTTLQEFARAVDSASTTPGLDSMILDMRSNVGGALDFLQNFLGLFIGDNQYAFDLYHQGDYEVQRTVQPVFPELSRYGDIAILTDGLTQSTAELTTATMKRMRLAHVVGVTTRGWGTVENTYPLATEIDPATKFTLLLVNSLTLRDDNQPIEGNGVVPDVDTSKAGWQGRLPQYFRSASLIQALADEATKPPLH